jgi:hypothetical protein
LLGFTGAMKLGLAPPRRNPEPGLVAPCTLARCHRGEGVLIAVAPSI